MNGKVDNKDNNLVKKIIAFFAFAIPVGIAIYFGLKSNKLENEKYALDYMPKIKYAGRLFFTEFSLGDSVPPPNYHKLEVDSALGILYPFRAFVKFNLALTNIGQSTANWKEPVILDVSEKTENFVIRDLLFKDDFLNQVYTHEKAESETKLIKEVDPKDSIHLSVSKNLINFDNNLETTVHIVFFYTGDNNVLYDTYMWVHLKVEDTLKFAIKNDKQKPGNFIKADVICCESKSYTETEKEIIYRKLGLKD